MGGTAKKFSPRRVIVAQYKSSGTFAAFTFRLHALLIPRVSRRARERNHVAEVPKAGRVGNGALEAQAEARVRYRAVAAQIAIPAVVFLVETGSGHACVQYLESFFTLTTA